MADNIDVTPGTGATVAADDVGGFLHQRVKISQGADGSATDVSSSAPLQVTLANTASNSNKLLTTPDLPSGASTGAKQDTGNTSLSSIDGKITAVNTGAVVISSSALPSGAATAAKQPALGTAGTASADVITVQGKASMTPVLTDGSGATQPVSGTVAVTGVSTSTKQSDGSQKTQLVDVSGNVETFTNVNGTTQSANVYVMNDTAGSPLGRVTLTDSTNTNQAAIKAASTAAVAADKALVVAVSPNNPITIAASDTSPATQNITVVDATVATTTGANSQSIYTGTPDAGSAATFALSSVETVDVQVSGTWTGTLQAEISFDGGTRYYARGVHQFGSSYTATTFTANFGGLLNVSGMTHFRMRATAAMTGTATVKVVSSLNTQSVYLANTAKISDPTTPTQQLAVGSTGAAAVNNSQVAGTTVDTNSGNKSGGTQRVVLATDQPALTNKLLVTPDSVALPANQSVNISQMNGVTTTMGNGASGTGVQRVTIASDSTGQVALASGTALVGDVGVQPRTSNGLTTFMASGSDGSTALTNTSQVVKASAGMLYGWYIYNPNTIAQYVHLYNTASASVTVGTTNPLFTLTIPPLTAANVMNPLGITFSNAGWATAATSTAGGNGAPTTALDVILWFA